MERKLTQRKAITCWFLKAVYVRAVTDDIVFVQGMWSSVVTIIKPCACFLCVWPYCMLCL